MSFPSAPPVAHTKLLSPPLPADFLPRPRLLAALQKAVTGHRLTLISAPAGSGKTTLAANLSDLPVAWLSLDEIDDEPLHFLLTVSAALGQLTPGCGQATRAFLEGMNNPERQIERAVAVLINEIVETMSEPFVLVLDDLYVISEPAVYDALDYLLERLPSHMHLLVTTREDPPLRLSRLRARGQLAELHLRDMRFTTEETGRFLNEKKQLNLASGELALLQERTEGWPAGLRLLARSLRAVAPGERERFLRDLAPTHRALFDFLAEEVLDQQETALRTFLLQISILPELTATACEAVTGRTDARELLAILHRRNLFLELIDHGKRGQGAVYRLHDLFAGFLRQRLAEERPNEIASLRRRAAAAATRPEERIRHLLAGGLWEDAASALSETGEKLLAHGMPVTLSRWIAALPPRQQKRPRLAYLQGVCALYRRDTERAKVFLEEALAAFRAQDDEIGAGLALASLVNIAFFHGAFPHALDLTAQALAYPAPPTVRVKLRTERARVVLFQGKLKAARSDLDAAWSTARSSGDEEALLTLLQGYIPGFIGLPGGLERLEQLCHQAEASASLRHDHFRITLDRARALLHFYRGEFDAALGYLGNAHARADVFGTLPPWEHWMIRLGEVMIRTALREPLDIAEDVEALLAVDNIHPVALNGFYYAVWHCCWLQQRVGLGRPLYDRLQQLREGTDAVHGNIGFPIFLASAEGQMALYEGRLPDAIKALEEAARMEKQAAFFNLFGSARTQLAYAYLESGREADALPAITTALAEASEQGAPGRLLLEGRAAIPALELAAAHGVRAKEASDLLERLGASSRGPVSVPDTGEHLTPREIEVLSLLLEGATNKQIAGELVISIHTAKRHVSSILAKMGVDNRTEASARARELGLCP